MAKSLLKSLLKANPAAQKHEKAIREALKDVDQLRKDGFAGDGYRLVSPYGEKRQLRASEGMIERRPK